MKTLKAFSIGLVAVALACVGVYGAGTTIAGTRVINSALSVLGTLTAANGAVLGTPASVNLSNATALPCAAMPALTGSISSSAGSCTTTGGGGGLVLVQQHTASNSASLDFKSTDSPSCISSTYDDYKIEFVDLLAQTDGVQLYWRASTDGTTFDSGSNYMWAGRRNSTTGGDTADGGSNSATQVSLSTGGNSGNATAAIVGTIQFYHPGGTALYKGLVGQLVVPYSSAGNASIGTIGGYYKSASAVLGFQVLFSSGNIVSGTVRCYGVAKS